MPRPADRGERVALRAALAASQGERCHYCRRRFRTRPGRLATLDHVVPLCRGGADDERNLVACCASCNARKGDLPATEFIAGFLQR